MRKSKPRTKKAPKRVLALPDLEHAKTAVLNSLSSASGQRTYEHRFASSWRGTVPNPGSRSIAPLCSGTASTSKNADTHRRRSIFGWPLFAASHTGRRRRSPEPGAGGRCPPSEGGAADRRTPRNWLTPEQGRRLVEVTASSSPRELRDQAMVAMLIGCGLRRGELLALQLESIQQREEHWVIVDLVGKGGHVRIVPIPTWVKHHIDAWTAAAAITHGPVFRAIDKAGRVWGDGMSPKVLWDVVRGAAARTGIRQAGAARSAAHVRPSLSSRRRRTGSNPVPAR